MGENLVLMPDVREQTILVVDDSNITRSLIERVYKDQYKILMASNGREAIDIVVTWFKHAGSWWLCSAWSLQRKRFI